MIHLRFKRHSHESIWIRANVESTTTNFGVLLFVVDAALCFGFLVAFDSQKCTVFSVAVVGCIKEFILSVCFESGALVASSFASRAPLSQRLNSLRRGTKFFIYIDGEIEKRFGFPIPLLITFLL